MTVSVGVVQFPGTNCELDVEHVVETLGGHAERLFHTDATVRGVDVVVVPGGFAHGDYLRAGAMARFSPIMDEVVAFAKRGGPVLGICNGFQVLTEAGLPTTTEESLATYMGLSTRSWAALAGERLGRPLPDGLVDRYHDEVHAELERAGANAGVRFRNKVTSDAAMTVMGVSRYWRKRHPERLNGAA